MKSNEALSRRNGSIQWCRRYIFATFVIPGSLEVLQIVDVYRSKLRNHLHGLEGDEIARQRIEEFANGVIPPGLLVSLQLYTSLWVSSDVDLQDHVKIHSVDLGVSAPRLSNARLSSRIQHDFCSVGLGISFKPSPLTLVQEIEFDMTYTDTVSVSLSTSYLFHHPKPYFLRLPVSLSISLSLFKASVCPPFTVWYAGDDLFRS
jgi:maintenance of morphology protein 1